MGYHNDSFSSFFLFYSDAVSKLFRRRLDYGADLPGSRHHKAGGGAIQTRAYYRRQNAEAEQACALLAGKPLKKSGARPQACLSS